jgi:hypothetical protein
MKVDVARDWFRPALPRLILARLHTRDCISKVYNSATNTQLATSDPSKTRPRSIFRTCKEAKGRPYPPTRPECKWHGSPPLRWHPAFC